MSSNETLGLVILAFALAVPYFIVIVNAFKRSATTGFLCLLVPLYTQWYAISHLEHRRKRWLVAAVLLAPVFVVRVLFIQYNKNVEGMRAEAAAVASAEVKHQKSVEEQFAEMKRDVQAKQAEVLREIQARKASEAKGLGGAPPKTPGAL